MTLADRIVVLGPSGVQQIGPPMVLYDEPANIFVAGFIGSPKMNLVGGSLDHDGHLSMGAQVPLAWTNSAAAGQNVTVGIRPEHLVPDLRGSLRGNVMLVERLGAESYVHLDVPGVSQPLVVAIKGEPPLGDTPWAVRPLGGRLHVFGADGNRIDEPAVGLSASLSEVA
jgi:multiple sugar transport system ATP-binding protein